MTKFTWYELPLRRVDPTPFEIARECDRIQNTWDERTKRARQLGIADGSSDGSFDGMEFGYWTIPEIHVRQIAEILNDEY